MVIFPAHPLGSGGLGPRPKTPPEVGTPLESCMDRTHGGRVFGDMVDTFEYVRHRA